MLSRPIYEAMPKLYIGAGILNVAVLDSPLKYLSAGLLVGAGILVILWRRQARGRGQSRTAAKVRAGMPRPRSQIPRGAPQRAPGRSTRSASRT